MTWALLKRTWRDGRVLLAACAVTLLAFAWVRILIVASMETHQFQRLARNLPEIIQRLAPVPIDQLVSYPGLIGFTFEEPLAYLIMAVWTIARASDSVSGELGRGSLEMLLAQPVSRSRYLVTHLLITLLGIAILAGAAYAGTHLGIRTTGIRAQQPPRTWTVPFFGTRIPAPTTGGKPETVIIPMSHYVKPRLFVIAALNYAALGVFLAGVTTAVSALDRNRGRTIGLIVGFYVIETVLELTGMAVEGCRWLLRLTFFAAYEPVAFVTASARNPAVAWSILSPESKGQWPDLGPIGCDLLLASLGLLGMLLGVLFFCRRDLPAPL